MPNGTGKTVRTRKDALKMDLWDPTLLWYARAVGEMKKRRLNDPTSWKYQAAIHGYTVRPDGSSASAQWQQWITGETPPTQQQTAFWEQCQHGSWYFLPWHRMYLGYFKKIVAATVAQLGGPKDWALPYWNYSSATASGTLPAAFFQAQTPDQVVNPLLEPNRDSGNDGQPFLPASDVDVTKALREPRFGADLQGGSSGFGGPRTQFSHSHGPHGALEQIPHDLVHDDIGGLMGDPETAGYDPIFWFHHANIDRLWEVWRNTTPPQQNPTDSSWLKFSFKFKDGSGNVQTLALRDVLDTKSLAPDGWRAHRDCLCFGMDHGIHCVGNCGLLMLASTLSPWRKVIMAVATLILIYERYRTRPGSSAVAATLGLLALGHFFC